MKDGMMKRQRSDAKENLQELLKAATALFAERGIDVPLAAVAEQAGVSRTTLYRNFPDREALILAIFEQNVAALEAMAAAVPRADGFVAILREMRIQMSRDAGLADALTKRGHELQPLTELRERMVRMLAPLMREGVAAGQLRKDMTERDIGYVLDVMGAVSREHSVAYRRAALDRSLELMISGMRPNPALDDR